MEREVVIGNRALEELLERLLRWGELCEQLRELYYRYLDLATFRSEKCYFPGRRCKRSWKREYDAGDLTLMWSYVLSTAPFCGKLMRALTEVELKIRLKVLESIERYGGVEKRHKPDGVHEIINIKLRNSIYGYLIMLENKLYILWNELNNLFENSRDRSVEIERVVVDIIERYKRGEKVEAEVDEYEVDREYERLWLEVPLPESVSKLLGGRAKVPVVLFRNLGWLLSDDSRYGLVHISNNPGQTAVRIFDWIAIAMYAKGGLQSSPLVFKFTVHQATRSRTGINPSIEVWPIGTTVEIIKRAYSQFGIALGKPKRVITHGYTILKALREGAFKREGLIHVVDDVGAWIAFSVTVTTFVLGDGHIKPVEFVIITKFSSGNALKGEAVGVRELAKAIGGASVRKEVYLQGRYMRLLLPVPPTPAFEKTVKLYEALVNYPVAAVVEINGTTYLLSHRITGYFTIGKEKATELYEAVKRLGIKMKVKKDVFALRYTQLLELAKHVPVRLLNDLEKDAIKEVKSVSSPDLEAVKRVLYEVAKMARITVGLRQGREYIGIIPRDKSKLWEIVTMLKTAGMRISVDRSRGRIYIYERKSIEAIRRIMPHLFSIRPFSKRL